MAAILNGQVIVKECDY